MYTLLVVLMLATPLYAACVVVDLCEWVWWLNSDELRQLQEGRR